MSTLAAGRTAPVVRAAAAGGALLPLWIARGSMLLAFAAFSGLHWAGLLDPAAPGRAWESVGLAALVVLGLVGAARLARPLCWLAATLVAVAAIALALLAGGLADEFLRPDHWSALASGAGRGIAALPGVRVPYRGVDEWTRLAIGAGGTLLVVLAALLAFWPRRERTGFPAAALLVLVTIYVVPAVILSSQLKFLGGAALALLLLAFLRLEKLRMRDAPAAGAVAIAAAIGALVVAPALDGEDPWFDYESWAVETASAESVTFSWDHDYSPLDWPRDGRELLRIKAREPAYWKARDLALFDGRSWRQDPRQRGEESTAQLPDNSASIARWRQHIEVTVRNLRSDSFVTAGIATAVDGEAAYPIGGGVFNAPDGLNRGDSYSADVYTPKPSDRQLRDDLDTDYADWLRSYVAILVRDSGATPGAGEERSVPYRVTWPFWGEPGEVEAERFADLKEPASIILEHGNLARVWELAQRLRSESETPYEYVSNVEAFLADGFGYSEQPPRASATLDGFLFDSKLGLLPAVLGRRGAVAADGGDPGAGRDRLHLGLVRRPPARVRRARPRRALVGRGVVPGLRLGDARPDAGGGAAALAVGRGREGAAGGAHSRGCPAPAASA